MRLAAPILFSNSRITQTFVSFVFSWTGFGDYVLKGQNWKCGVTLCAASGLLLNCTQKKKKNCL